MFQTFDETALTNAIAPRVAQLRQAMATLRIDAFLVPRGDRHRGEYVAAHDERLKWLTAFSGSAGLAIVAARSAVLFVDGRYTVQARQQTDTSLFEIQQVPAAKTADWLQGALGTGQTVGFDPWLHSIDEIEQLEAALKSKGIRLKALPRNPIDKIWGADQPPPPAAPVVAHPLSRAGRSAEEKIADVQAALAAAGEDAIVLTLTDSVAWLFNIRGSDIPHTPAVLAFAIVPAEGRASLFVEHERLGEAHARQLEEVADLVPPEALTDNIDALKAAGKRVRLNPATAAYWFSRRLGEKCVSRGPDPCQRAKAIKNAAEIKGTRAAHHRDGVAVCRFLAWFDREAPPGRLDEIKAASELEAFRAETGKLKEISFDTIAGSGPNGAIVHYRVNTESNRRIGRGELFLVDSGAQYADGTTDVTRTIAIGRPKPEMRTHYTLVLKGHIAIATAVFPEGTRGVELDPLARQALWRHGLDYDHGTGHGVGSYLSVHEGPQSISRRGEAVLEAGMIISNEPGFYLEGAYGIRIENLVLVNPPQKPEGGDRAMLSFETLTLAPFDRRLIDTKLLTGEEKAWVDAYHKRVMAEVGPELDAADRRWLEGATKRL
jgi:Xaa-Pro aminopeptidase